MNLGHKMAIIFLLMMVIPVYGSIELRSEVSRDRMNLGERFTYSVTITGKLRLPEIDPPDFEGLELMTRPMTSSSTQVINGVISRSSTLTYVLKAVTSGTITIAPAQARKGKTIFQSQPIQITVLGGGGSKPSQSRSTSIPSPTLEESPDVFLTVKANKSEAYIREMVTVTYRLYISVRAINYEFSRMPKTTGFWQEEFKLPSRPQLTPVTIRGKQYQVAVVRKIALFPTRTGTLTMEPLVAGVTVEVAGSRQRGGGLFDVFDPFFGRSRRKTVSVSTESLNLTVLDLPQRGRPDNFRGDVGDFNLAVKYDKSHLAQHDALAVTVTVSGKGYLKSIDAPELNLPSGFERFDPTVEEKITRTGNSVRGRKIFTYLIIPRRSGAFDLEPVRFSYFDPATKKYRTKTGGGKSLNVSPSTSQADIGGGSYGPSGVTMIDQDIRFIKDLNNPLTLASTPSYRSLWFYLALGLFPLLYLLGVGAETVLDHRLSNPSVLRRRLAPKKMKQALDLASGLIQNQKYSEAIEILGQNFAKLVGAVIDTPTAGLTADSIRQGLTVLECDKVLIEGAISLLNEADRVKFGGASFDKDYIEEILDRFRDVSVELEKLR
ncbi:MAG: BatD family protein [Candidatus Electryoneaceae bacterium]|nr:BatD family protein [Candidatus Electryoneaceae bacterium]